MAWETDRRRLEQRQKQIDFGLATTGYANYVSWLRSNKGRVKPIPIPNIYIKCSKRSWDGQIRHWRRLLHLWDSIELPTGTPADQQFEDPCAREDVDYADEEFPQGLLDAPNPLTDLAQRGFHCPAPQWHDPNAHRFSSDFPDAQAFHMSSAGPQARNAPSSSWQNPNAQRFPPDVAGGYAHTGQFSRFGGAVQYAPVPQMQYVPHEQFPPQLPHPAYAYAMGPSEWPMSMYPRGYPPPSSEPFEGEMCAAPFLFVADQEAAGRRKIAEAEAATLKADIYTRYCGALKAASAAQRQLALISAPPSQSQWTDANLDMLLGKEFSSKDGQPCSSADELLPPSLSEMAVRHPTSPGARSESNRSCASFGDLHLDEERYSNFRRHFKDAPGTSGAASPLESPPPCWSPARLTPGAKGQPHTLSPSPGLTPSPAVWLAQQRSPMSVSPPAALGFSDWASPQVKQASDNEKAKSLAGEAIARTSSGHSDA